MRKKRICLVTSWYPSKDNPYRGVFFKEQAFAVEKYFDFLVIHLNIKRKKKPGKNYLITKCNKECNTVEYNVDVFLPIMVYFADIFLNLKKKIQKDSIAGIGRYVSAYRKNITKRILKKVFEKEFLKKFDILYCVDAQKEAQDLKIISEITGKPYIIGEHAPFPWPGTVISDAAKEAIEQASLYFAISYDKIRQMMLQNIKLPKTVLIGNLVDEKEFFYKEKPTSGHVKTFVIVAAHSWYKNYDLFIKVMDRLVQITNQPFKIMVVGYGANKGYSKNAEILENKIRNSSFAGITEMIPSVEHECMGTVYNRADAFIMTSVQEGMPVSAIEAACCGLPVFSTMCGGVEDYVTDKIGRIYKITDYKSFADGLRDYLEGKIDFNPQYIRNYIIKKYGKEAFIKNFTLAVNSIIN